MYRIRSARRKSIKLFCLYPIYTLKKSARFFSFAFFNFFYREREWIWMKRRKIHEEMRERKSSPLGNWGRKKLKNRRRNLMWRSTLQSNTKMRQKRRKTCEVEYAHEKNIRNWSIWWARNSKLIIFEYNFFKLLKKNQRCIQRLP